MTRVKGMEAAGLGRQGLRAMDPGEEIARENLSLLLLLFLRWNRRGLVGNVTRKEPRRRAEVHREGAQWRSRWVPLCSPCTHACKYATLSLVRTLLGPHSHDRWSFTRWVTKERKKGGGDWRRTCLLIQFYCPRKNTQETGNELFLWKGTEGRGCRQTYSVKEHGRKSRVLFPLKSKDNKHCPA